MNGFSEPLRRFVIATIDSVDQIELLALLRAQPERAYTAQQLEFELRSSSTAVVRSLQHLIARGLCADEKGRFRYSAPPDRDDLVGELLSAYTEYRARLIELIYSKPSRNLRDFSDAFRLRRDET